MPIDTAEWRKRLALWQRPGAGAGANYLHHHAAEAADEIDTLRGAMAADDERLRVAGARVGIEHGCDTPEWMADEIEALRAEVRRLKVEQVVAGWGFGSYDGEETSVSKWDGDECWFLGTDGSWSTYPSSPKAWEDWKGRVTFPTEAAARVVARQAAEKEVDG